MSVLVAKLIRLVHGDFYCQKQNESKQKRPPWQEAVFSVANNLGRLSPQGGDLVQNHIEHIIDGGNHAAFGDYGTQKGDGKASTSAEDQRKETVKVVVDAIRSQ